MRRCPREVREKRAVFVLADKVHPRLVNQILRECFARGPASRITFERDAFAVANQATRKMRVGVNLMVVTKKSIETMLFGHARCSDVSQAPLAKAARGVALLFEQFCHGHIIGPQRQAARIAANCGVSRMHAGH